MPYRIEIGLRHGVPDARGDLTALRAQTTLGFKDLSVRTRTVYLIDAELAQAELAAAQKAFTDTVIETSACGRLPPPGKFDWLIEIGFKPGVTDNVGRTARSALQDVLDRPLPAAAGVYTAIQYFISSRPSLNRTKINRLAGDLLANPLIQTIAVYKPAKWRRRRPEAMVPAIHDTQHVSVNTYDLQGTDADLMRLSREKILSCSLDEMRAIRDYFKRDDVSRARRALGLPPDPTDVEVECIAQTWSEHCSHKIFAADIEYTDANGEQTPIKSLYRTFIKASTRKIARKRNWLVSVFTDNAGIIRFTPRLHLVYKVETHNSPSALDPYGGAMTGIVGVNRDPMGTGMGAALLCNVWGYCLGSPFHNGKIPAGLMHPRRIRDGVHQGVIEGGNQSGIPWMRGWEVFDERFTGKPLVFCGTVGTLPVKVTGRPAERKEVRSGDILVVTGGRIGKDGIHGATFSSEELREESPVQAVQIGDPITQRKMYEFLLEARDLGLFRCITDNGAGGLSCSAGEMGRLAGGVEIDLARAPLKYQGLQPWEILLSEAQERMTLAVAPGKLKALLELARRRDVEATALGTFTDSGEYVIKYGQQTVGRLDMQFLYDGCPTLQLRARWRPPRLPAPAHPRQHDHGRLLRDLLSSLDVCSREYKSRQYDGEVKGLSVVKPFVGVNCDMPADATVMRVAYDEQAGIVLAEGVNPFLSDIDTYAMTAAVIDEAVRRAISAGADPEHIAGLDNFCWPDPVQSKKTPDGEYKLAQLVRSCQALYDVTTAYGIPCISGKDSCKNDSTRGGRKISIPPTLLFSVIARINDVRQAVTMDAKQPGDLVYLLGLTRPELGASALHRLLAARMGKPQHIGGRPPILETKPALRLYRALHRAIGLDLLHSSHTPTRGGLAVGLALKALGGDLGMDIKLQNIPTEGDPDPTARLFAECNSRFVVTVQPAQAPKLENIFRGLPCARIGRVTARRRLLVRRRETVLLDAPLRALRQAFRTPLQGI